MIVSTWSRCRVQDGQQERQDDESRGDHCDLPKDAKRTAGDSEQDN